MFFYIKHIHRISFGMPVFCEPALIRLHPHSCGNARVHAARLQLQPGVGELFSQQDLNGNHGWKVVFSDITVSLTITAISCVEVWPQACLTVLSPEAVTLPARHRDVDADLADYYARPECPSQTIRNFAASAREESDGTTLHFIDVLLARFASDFHWTRDGRCQDPSPIAWLHRLRGSTVAAAGAFAEVARAMKIPARLVRGYNAARADEIESGMSVWTELHLPGAGWRGFDPVAGQAVDEGYIAVAKAKTLGGTEPVVGSFRGAVRSPRVETQIIIRQAAQSRNVHQSGELERFDGNEIGHS